MLPQSGVTRAVGHQVDRSRNIVEDMAYLHFLAKDFACARLHARLDDRRGNSDVVVVRQVASDRSANCPTSNHCDCQHIQIPGKSWNVGLIHRL